MVMLLRVCSEAYRPQQRTQNPLNTFYWMCCCCWVPGNKAAAAWRQVCQVQRWGCCPSPRTLQQLHTTTQVSLQQARTHNPASVLCTFHDDYDNDDQYSQEVADARPPRIRGVVISKRRKGIDSGFTMINVRLEPCVPLVLHDISLLARTNTTRAHTAGSRAGTRARGPH